MIFAPDGPATDAAAERDVFDEDSKTAAFHNSLVLVGREASAAKGGDILAILGAPGIQNPGNLRRSDPSGDRLCSGASRQCR